MITNYPSSYRGVKSHGVKVFEAEVKSLLKNLKKGIQNDDRAHEDDTLPGMLVTIGAQVETDGSFSWNYQTGDNSYTGGAYGYPNWAVIYLYRRSNCQELAQDAVMQISEHYF